MPLCTTRGTGSHTALYFLTLLAGTPGFVADLSLNRTAHSWLGRVLFRIHGDEVGTGTPAASDNSERFQRVSPETKPKALKRLSNQHLHYNVQNKFIVWCTLAQRESYCYLPANSFLLSVPPVLSLGNCELHLAKGYSRLVTY